MSLLRSDTHLRILPWYLWPDIVSIDVDSFPFGTRKDLQKLGSKLIKPVMVKSSETCINFRDSWPPCAPRIPYFDLTTEWYLERTNGEDYDQCFEYRCSTRDNPRLLDILLNNMTLSDFDYCSCLCCLHWQGAKNYVVQVCQGPVSSS